MKTFSIVIPVYGNAQTLPMLLDRLQEIANTLAPDRLEAVFTVDASPDDSWLVLQQHLPAMPFSAS